MIIRAGFVSNSSSSSFVIAKAHMTEEQIKEFSDFVKNSEADEFYTYETKHYFEGHGESWEGDIFPQKLRDMSIDKEFILEMDI